MLIKICGVTCPETAKFAAQEGADYIGMILWEKSKRFVDRSQALEIADAARRGGAFPVAVFVEERAEEMAEICQVLGVDILQLHGENSKEEAFLLPENLQRVFALAVDESGHLEAFGSTYRENDFLLVDSVGGGSGKAFPWKKLQKPVKTPWILAGGLHPENIQAAIEILQPDGVDVSTGVETGVKGVKSHELIRKFIERVKYAPTR